MNNESEKFDYNLMRTRSQKSITQGDIVRPLSPSRGFVSNMGNAKTNFTLATIARLANAIGVSSDELLK